MVLLCTDKVTLEHYYTRIYSRHLIASLNSPLKDIPSFHKSNFNPEKEVFYRFVGQLTFVESFHLFYIVLFPPDVKVISFSQDSI